MLIDKLILLLNRSLKNSTIIRLQEQPTYHSGRHCLGKRLKYDGVGVELGVASGNFSNSILANSQLNRLYSIDRWSDHHNDKEYLLCVSKLSKYQSRSVIMRMDFSDAIRHFEDSFFDFIYIDAYAHEGQQDGNLLKDWWPKLKPGGLFSGHDYDEAWPQTIEAVDRFATEVQRPVEVIPGSQTPHIEDSFASWLIKK